MNTMLDARIVVARTQGRADTLQGVSAAALAIKASSQAEEVATLIFCTCCSVYTLADAYEAPVPLPADAID
ncbi:hypothetical protein [Noviherbaspirillum denitrificans]|uniref:hypothetical protein n=1 Tax=Noviherbaspirillum denitrificans TaxID=1968433 RepID=UPI001F1D8F82|nr:hypothetical protein [Noviherbaspirillum denitrificans]